MPRRRDPLKQASAMVPMELESAREKLLAMAGFPLAKRAEIVKRAIEAQVEALDAVAPAKLKRTTEADGKVREEVQEGGAPDWDARLRSADALEGLFGAVASRASSGPTGPAAVTITVELPQYAQTAPVVIDAHPADPDDQGFPVSATAPQPQPAAKDPDF